VMRQAGDRVHGLRLRELIVVMWRAGLRIGEALALTESDLDPDRGAILVRHGKGDKRLGVGRDQSGVELLRPWLAYRVQIPVGPLFCVIDGRTRGKALTRGKPSVRGFAARAMAFRSTTACSPSWVACPTRFARPVGRPRLTPRAPSQSSSPRASPSTTTPALRNHSGSRRRTGSVATSPRREMEERRSEPDEQRGGAARGAWHLGFAMRNRGATITLSSRSASSAGVAHRAPRRVGARRDVEPQACSSRIAQRDTAPARRRSRALNRVREPLALDEQGSPDARTAPLATPAAGDLATDTAGSSRSGKYALSAYFPDLTARSCCCRADRPTDRRSSTIPALFNCAASWATAPTGASRGRRLVLRGAARRNSRASSTRRAKVRMSGRPAIETLECRRSSSHWSRAW
jgi:integrase-like protein